MTDQFKRLGFVESTACSALDTAGSTYSSARDKTLNASSFFLEGFFTKMESVIGPMLSFSKTCSHDMLLFVDTTVDKSVCAVAQTAKITREQATKLVGEERVKPVENLASDTMATVSTTIYDRIPAAARSVHSSVHDTAASVYTGVTGAMSSAAQRLMGGVRAADKAVAGTAAGMQTRAAAARDSVYSRVFVPVSDYSKELYTTLRDAIVTQPLYAKGYYTTASALSTLCGSPPAKSAASLFASKVYPVIEPLAAPIISTSEPYVSAALREVEPSGDAAANGHPADNGGELTMRKVATDVKEAPKKVARSGKAAAKPAAVTPVESVAKDE